MLTSSDSLRLYAVTDRACLKGVSLETAVAEAIRGGVTLVQLREKALDEEAFYKEAVRIKEICDSRGIPLIINDNVGLCRRIGASGVHVGLSDMGVREARRLLGPGAIIGATAHNLEEAVTAWQAGADYLGIGAAFGSATKTDASAFDIANYNAITARVGIPVVAIGGINRHNLPQLTGRGLKGVAVVSGLFGAEDIAAEAAALLSLAESL